MKKLNKLFAGLLITCTCTSCGDFLDAYSQDMVIPKSVTNIDEVLLGEVYVNSFTTAYGPTAMRTCGFFNILDDDLNTGLTGYGGGKACTGMEQLSVLSFWLLCVAVKSR